ncbi:MAG TPA: hypothetical protein VMW16_02365 [Sedimentisphaerales bacterium]|nr:hypothetical protein [Sedimentisphaerales bacterium]
MWGPGPSASSACVKTTADFGRDDKGALCSVGMIRARDAHKVYGGFEEVAGVVRASGVRYSLTPSGAGG